MDEDDYRALIEELVGQLRQIGADEIADQANYVVTNLETGEGELLVPRERLIAMLLAFERFLAVRDGKVARVALDRIGATLRQSGTDPGEVRIPNGAYVVLTSERDLASVEVNLLDAPDLAEIRADVDWLIRQLQPRDGGASPRAAP